MGNTECTARSFGTHPQRSRTIRRAALYAFVVGALASSTSVGAATAEESELPILGKITRVPVGTWSEYQLHAGATPAGFMRIAVEAAPRQGAVVLRRTLKATLDAPASLTIDELLELTPTRGRWQVTGRSRKVGGIAAPAPPSNGLRDVLLTLRDFRRAGSEVIDVAGKRRSLSKWEARRDGRRLTAWVDPAASPLGYARYDVTDARNRLVSSLVLIATGP